MSYIRDMTKLIAPLKKGQAVYVANCGRTHYIIDRQAPNYYRVWYAPLDGGQCIVQLFPRNQLTPVGWKQPFVQ